MVTLQLVKLDTGAVGRATVEPGSVEPKNRGTSKPAIVQARPSNANVSSAGRRVGHGVELPLPRDTLELRRAAVLGDGWIPMNHTVE